MDKQRYNLAIIGGGPAGLMAASRAGELGAKVLVLEKNERPGNKLLITGKGRCNITNQTDDAKEFAENFGKKGKFLYSSLFRFGPADIISFLEERGVLTKTERGNRVFPESDNAQEILEAFLKSLAESEVEIRTGQEVAKIVKKGRLIEKIVLISGEEIIADNYLVATGGLSYPGTGSTGDGYAWLRKLGHAITKVAPALTPVIVRENFIRDLEGLSLKNVKISILKDNKKTASRFGEAIFTGNGLSGPIILDMSKQIGEALPGQVELAIDFKPALGLQELDKRIQADFQAGSNRQFKNVLDRLLPQKIIPLFIWLSNIDPEKPVNLVTKEERKRLLAIFKDFRLTVDRLVGFEKAIVTAGGVDLSEVDPKTMRSKLIDNLYLAGEILDLDGPTGGFNLQVCWSTGFVAGESAAKNSKLAK